jgi:hypothetical protein
MKITKENLETAAELLSKNPLLDVFLRSAAPCGMTLLSFVEYMADLESVNRARKTMDATLRFMDNIGDYGLPMFFEKSSVSIAGGRGGGTPKAYLLTDFGEKVLRHVHPNLTIRKLTSKDMVDIRHRFCQLETYVLAIKQGWRAEVEKVLLYGTRNVRADLAITTPDGPLYVEIEQRLDKKNSKRAQDKIEHWNQYHAETGEIPRILFLFNLSEKEKSSTINLWRDAVWNAKPPFDVRYALMSSLKERGSLAGVLAGSQELAPVQILSEKKLDTSSWELPKGIDDDSFLEELRNYILIQEEHRDKLQKIRAKRAFAHPGLEYESLNVLVSSCEFIWSIDHKLPALTEWEKKANSDGYGDPTKVMDIPENSLGMLRYYLMRLPDLHQALQAVMPKRGLAITQQRMGMNAVVLTFLRYWRIWPTNQFSFRVDIPDHGDADFMPRVKLLGSYQIQEEKKIATEWVLTMLIAFPGEFGLS